MPRTSVGGDVTLLVYWPPLPCYKYNTSLRLLSLSPGLHYTSGNSASHTIISNMAAATTTSRAPPPSGLLARSATAATASQTQTQAPPLVQVRQPVLRLRGAETGVRSKKRIQWAEDVIDNEGLGRKSSKGNDAPCTHLQVFQIVLGSARLTRLDSMLHLSRPKTNR